LSNIETEEKRSDYLLSQSEPFNKDDIKEFLSEMTKSQKMSYIQYYELTMEKLKGISAKLMSFKDNNRSELTHFCSMLNSLILMDADVILIESVNSRGIRLYDDIDCCIRVGSETIFCDFKTTNSSSVKFINDHVKEDRLKLMFPGKNCKVLTGPRIECRIEIEHHKESSNYPEFEEISFFRESIMDYKLSEIESMINVVPKSVPSIKRSKPTKNIKFANREFLNLKNSVKHNNRDVARWFTSIIDTPQVGHDVSIFSDWESMETGSVSKMPLYENGSMSISEILLASNSNFCKDLLIAQEVGESNNIKKLDDWVFEFTFDEIIYQKDTKEIFDYAELEQQISTLNRILLEPVDECSTSRVINRLSESIDENCVNDLFLSNVTSLMSTVGKSTIMSFLDQHSSLSRAIIAKIQYLSKFKQKSSFKRGKIIITVSNLTDRNAVVIFNKAFYNNEIKNLMCKTVGFVSKSVKRFCSSTTSETGWFSLSPSNLSWYTTLPQKFLSVSSMYLESQVAKTDQKISFDPLVMIASIMLSNNIRFSQCSESVRYIFVASSGVSFGTSDLYDKIRHFTFKNMFMKLYLLRMFKMSYCMQMLWNSDHQNELLKRAEFIYEDNGETVKSSYKHLDIAMPEDSITRSDERMIFNSFYLSKLVNVNRYDDLQELSLIIEKQLENKISYDIARSKSEFKKFVSVQEVLDINFHSGSLYDPDWRTVCLGSLVTILRTSGPEDKDLTLREFTKTNYDETLINRLTVNEVMNNRSSAVSFVGGKRPDAKERRIDLSIKKIRIPEISSKSYLTSIINWSNKYEKGFYGEKKFSSLTEEDISKPSRLLPCICRDISENRPYQCNMFAKAQIGVREIALMNAEMRHGTYFLEELARSIRDAEHEKGVKTNLIEKRNKDSIITDMVYNVKRNAYQRGTNVIFDNSDASKWGPSMQSYSLLACLSLRVPDDLHYNLFESILKRFSKKTYRMPDAMFLKSFDSHGNSKVDKISSLIAGNPQEVESPEGMFQGILGNLSSVYHSDCCNLIETVNLKLNDIKMQSHCTSDDSVRAIWTDQKGVTISQLSKRSLLVICFVYSLYGIKRNMFKSTMSSTICEFNSVFRTFHGEYRPEIKTRISYVKALDSSDFFTASLMTLNRALAYLRNDGSVIGSSWIQLLNQSIFVQQFSAYDQLFLRDITKIPLEFLGLPEINTSLAVVCPGPTRYLKNYKVETFEDFCNYMDFFADCDNYDNQLISTDMEGEKAKIPKQSRSKTVNLLARVPKKVRKIREFLYNLDENVFLQMGSKSSYMTILPSLVNSVKREISYGDSDDEAILYFKCMRPKDSKCVYLNDKAYGERVITRVELFKLADFDFQWGNQTINGLKYGELPISIKSNMWKTYQYNRNNLNSIEIKNITRVPRHSQEKRELDMYSTWSEHKALVDNVISHVLSKGIQNGEVKESVITAISISIRLEKFYKSSSKFMLTLIPSDYEVSLMERIIRSNFIESCRAIVISRATSKPDGYKKFLKELKNHSLPIRNIEGSFLKSVTDCVLYNPMDVTDLILITKDQMNSRFRPSEIRLIWQTIDKAKLDLKVFFPKLCKSNISEKYMQLSGNFVSQTLREGSIRLAIKKENKWNHYLTGSEDTEDDNPSDLFWSQSFPNVVRISIDEEFIWLVSHKFRFLILTTSLNLKPRDYNFFNWEPKRSDESILRKWKEIIPNNSRSIQRITKDIEQLDNVDSVLEKDMMDMEALMQADDSDGYDLMDDDEMDELFKTTPSKVKMVEKLELSEDGEIEERDWSELVISTSLNARTARIDRSLTFSISGKLQMSTNYDFGSSYNIRLNKLTFVEFLDSKIKNMEPAVAELAIVDLWFSLMSTQVYRVFIESMDHQESEEDIFEDF